MKLKINWKQFHNAIEKAVKNKHKILCSLGFHKYNIKKLKDAIIYKCKYCDEEIIHRLIKRRKK